MNPTMTRTVTLDRIEYQGECLECGQVITVSITDQQDQAWRNGELIQKAMPEVSADDREFLISGICGGCFDLMWQEEHDYDMEYDKYLDEEDSHVEYYDGRA